MRRRLLLPLLVTLVACMGSECSSDGSSSFTSSNGSSVALDRGEPVEVIVAPVPEPSAMLVFAAGLALAGLALRRGRRS